MMSNGLRPERISSQRVLAWWDLDIHIGAFHKRKVTARPLKELECVLGHRLHVESWLRYETMPKGTWKFEAFNYLDIADPALAAYSTLKQLKPLSDWFGMSWQGFNKAPTTLKDDPDASTICAFYWNPPDQHGMPRYKSSGVLLRFGDLPCQSIDRRDRYHRSARPVVGVPADPQLRTDYMVEFDVHIVCSNIHELISYHWPRFQALHWPDGVAHFEVDAQTHAGKPYMIRVKQVLRGAREHEAVAYCLAYASGFRIKLDTDPELRFVGECRPSRDRPESIVAFKMAKITRTAN